MFKFSKKISTIILLGCLGIHTAFADEIIPLDRYKDPVKQFEFVHDVAFNDGATWSYYKLGTYYENGYGIKKDIIQAYAWYRLADMHDSTLGKEALCNLKLKMNNDQIAEGEKALKKITNAEMDNLQKEVYGH